MQSDLQVLDLSQQDTCFMHFQNKTLSTVDYHVFQGLLFYFLPQKNKISPLRRLHISSLNANRMTETSYVKQA